ncbi:MAG: 4Fe-4S dicluster domain-containing protein [Planctomycetaceae bacterium]
MTVRDEAPQFLPKAELGNLFAVLQRRGYTVIGPRIEQGAVVYEPIDSVDDLPIGWTDEHGPGHYRLHETGDGAHFNYVVGPIAWKKYLFPPRVTILESTKRADQWHFENPQPEIPKYAFLGVRACDLAAIAVQDRVFMSQQYTDPIYQQRREQALIIAVNCTKAAPTCFCTSMNTGPRCRSGFDIALTESPDGFLIETGTNTGRELIGELNTTTATTDQNQQAETICRQTTAQITKRLDTENVHDLLLGNLNHPQWDHLAERCLSCTNCTMVCPTCFCTSVTEVADLSGDHVTRDRHWDSCFNPAFSYIHGGNVRNSIRSRYRQWLTHKLASWIDQFGTSGCVGCGRCITWCPVGIDLTEEVAAIRDGAVINGSVINEESA